MRIVAGEFRGRRLKTPKGMLTRPTQDRVRETIFNVLTHHGLWDRKVLDFYAGTGALGLEALSRGAESLVAVDQRTATLIKENVELCQAADRVRILKMDVEKAASILKGEKFSLVFSDPPYRQGGIEKTIALLEKHDLLAEEALIVLEFAREEIIVAPLHWKMWKEQTFGETKVQYFSYRKE